MATSSALPRRYRIRPGRMNALYVVTGTVVTFLAAWLGSRIRHRGQ
ncbi:hypothetical protein ACWFR1_03220 [Streptomyces sp. NPDC055103]